MKTKYLILIIMILLVSCTQGADPPIEAMSKAEIQAWQTETFDFFDKNMAKWPEIDLFLATLADDSTFVDPSDGNFLVEGKAQIKALLKLTTLICPDVEVETSRMFISKDGAAYDNIWLNLWPPWVPEPSEHPPVHELDLIRFQDGLVKSFSIMFSKGTLEMTGFGCFAVEECPELQEIVDKYLSAWSSGDDEQVADLYSEEAVFSDSIRGMAAVGPEAIANLAEQRFGSIRDIKLEEIGLYTQTNGPHAPIDEQPEKGGIIGVGIHYRWYTIVEGASIEIESLTTFNLDSQGLITGEEVFHDADSLVAAGIVP